MMSFLLGAVFVSIAYIIGAKVGRLAHDEVASGGDYIRLVREAAILTAVALAAYLNNIPYYYLAPVILLGVILLWRDHEKIYPWMFAVVLFLSEDILITNTGLLFIAAFCTAALHYKKLEETSTFATYWPLPVTALLLWIIQFLS